MVQLRIPPSQCIGPNTYRCAAPRSAAPACCTRPPSARACGLWPPAPAEPRSLLSVERPPGCRRGDGTLSYFFSTEDLAARARSAGLQVQEADYVCVLNTNRKTGQQLRRVFVHGVFSKPGGGGAAGG
jgi:hypothetical protein